MKYSARVLFLRHEKESLFSAKIEYNKTHEQNIVKQPILVFNTKCFCKTLLLHEIPFVSTIFDNAQQFSSIVNSSNVEIAAAKGIVYCSMQIMPGKWYCPSPGYRVCCFARIYGDKKSLHTCARSRSSGEVTR